jgi:hypothetical protein
MPTRRLSKMQDEGRVPRSSTFGMLLRQYQLAAGLSQEALAERAKRAEAAIALALEEC